MKPCNIGSQSFSDGTPFVGPVLSPTKSHSITSLANRTWHKRHERNGCYSSSYNLNGILNLIKPVQNRNAIILNISPTCLNWKTMEVDSDLEIYAKHQNLSEDFEGTHWGPTEDACARLDCYAIWFQCAKCRH